MPELDGLETSRRIREVANRVPILALGTTAGEEDRYLEAGMDGAVEAPVSDEKLRAAITRGLNVI